MFVLMLALTSTVSTMGDARAVAPEPALPGQPATFLWADWDGDGLDDALSVSPSGDARVLRNRGDGTFEDATARAGLAGLSGISAAAWGDFDADGKLDLFVGQTPAGDKLYRNTGRGVFELTDLAPKHTGVARFAHWQDYDRDGLVDLHVHTDEGDLLYHNLGATRFERVELPEIEPRDIASRITDTESAREIGERSGATEGRVARTDSAAERDESSDAPSRRVAGSRDPSSSRPGASSGPTSSATGAPGGTHNPAPPPSCGGAPSVQDQSSASCILAASVPALGLLYPLSVNLNVDSSGRVGMGTTTPLYKLHVIDTAATGVFGQGGTTGVRGDANLAGSGNRYGGYFSSTGGSNNIGVYGTSDIGVYGLGSGFGAYGESNAPSGVGMYGKANHASGANIGVKAESLSTSGIGLDGRSGASTGSTIGVRGRVSSGAGIGVLGSTDSLFGGIGVRGEAISIAGTGVSGRNTVTTGTGNPVGVYGEVVHPTGSGVRGYALSSTGFAPGVEGISSASSGNGVYGQGSSFTGANYGVHGQSNSPDGFALYAEGRLRVDTNAVIGVPDPLTTPPTHRATVQSADANTMRLIGPGAVYGFAAKLNFGDGNYAFVEEDTDDHLHLSTRLGTKIESTDPVTALQISSTSNNGINSPTLSVSNEAVGAGVAIKAVSKGTDTTAVFTQQGSGAIISAFKTGSTPVFQVTNTGRCVTTALQITGGGDLVEGFHASAECEPGSVVVIDALHAGALTISSVPYDRKVAGVVSGAGGVAHGIRMGQDGVLDGDTLVAMTGRVYVRCTTENGAIAPGDRLTTSSTPAHAMKATDSELSNGAVIGKAMSALDEGTGLVLVLVNLQ